MRYLASEALPGGPPDILCRVSGRRTIVVAFVCFIVACTALIVAIERPIDDEFATACFYAISLIGFLFGAASYASYRRAIDPSNWVCQIKGDKLFLRCSRFWSLRAEPEIRSLEIPRNEIAWIQPLKVHSLEDERGRGPLRIPGGGIVHEWHTYLNIVLNESGTAAMGELSRDMSIQQDERELLIPQAYKPEQPVQLVQDGTIRVHWGDPISNVSPGIVQIATILSRWTEVRPLRHETVRRFFDN